MTTQPVPLIEAQPTPFQALVSAAPGPGGRQVVILTLRLITGQVTVFLDADGSESLARDLIRFAATARSGLIIPGGNGRPV